MSCGTGSFVCHVSPSRVLPWNGAPGDPLNGLKTRLAPTFCAFLGVRFNGTCGEHLSSRETGCWLTGGVQKDAGPVVALHSLQTGRTWHTSAKSGTLFSGLRHAVISSPVPILFCFSKVGPVREMAMTGALTTSQQFLQGGDAGSGNGGLHSTGFLFAWWPRSHHMSCQPVGWHLHQFSNVVGLSASDCVCNAVD